MTPLIIENVEIVSIQATTKTKWLFVIVKFETGELGLGEATLDGYMDEVHYEIRRRADALIGTNVSEIALTGHETLVNASAISALNQALCDGMARKRGVSVAALLGGEQRQKLTLYANINRRTNPRTVEDFAESAQLALDAGFRAFKIAPFDEVMAGSPLNIFDLSKGLARIEAVRAVIGTENRLMVDCHWRFDASGASSLIDACTDYNLHWIECPLPEQRDTYADIAKIRKLATRRNIRLAGGEDIIGVGGLRPYLDHGCYDVIMPDVKYVGGPLEMLRVAETLEKAGVEFSPHNPSGPVSHAASMEVCAAARCVDLLEYQFAETPLFVSLVRGGTSLAANVELDQARMGFGISFQPEVLAQYLHPQSKAMEDAYEKVLYR